jgi:magnesium transporter
MPINILAGIGGMSEFSMMTKDFNIGWPFAYAGFLIGSVFIGWATYHLLKFFEAREARRILATKGQKPA